jgi:hypothetical protein
MTLDHASIARRRLHMQRNTKAADSHQRQPDATVSDDPKSYQSEALSPTQSFDRPSVTPSTVIQSTIPRWEAPPEQLDTEASVARCSAFQVSLAFANDRRPCVSEWEHALVNMNETYQAYCDESKAFGMSSRPWESASVPLDLYPDLLSSENSFGMPDTNDLFDLNWITCNSSDSVWQPEMTTWTT